MQEQETERKTPPPPTPPAEDGETRPRYDFLLIDVNVRLDYCLPG